MGLIIKWFKPVDISALLINLLVLGSGVVLIISHPNLPPKIPFWFSKPWGVGRLAEPYYLWLLPTLILIFFLASNLVAKLITKNHPILAKILVWSATLISTVFLLTLYRIILVVV
jgi:hypothetical protein